MIFLLKNMCFNFLIRATRCPYCTSVLEVVTPVQPVVSKEIESNKGKEEETSLVDLQEFDNKKI